MFVLQNEALSVTLSVVGGELQSVTGRDGTEYLWHGDPAYWPGRAPHLFPFVGRFESSRYACNGRQFASDLHGFFRRQPLSLESQSNESVRLGLTAGEPLLQAYPFPFHSSLTYTLHGCTLQISFRVDNIGSQPMYFSYGGHPGFAVPLTAGLRFSDYELVFPEVSDPVRIGFTQSGLVSGENAPFPLQDGRSLPLHHRLFDQEAVVLKGAPRRVTLRSGLDAHSVTLSCPQMPYMGIWHTPHTDAPFVCLEPWTSLPGRSGVLERLEDIPDYIHLSPGAAYENTWEIRFD